MSKRKCVTLCLSSEAVHRLPTSWLRYPRMDELALDSRDPGYSKASTGAGRKGTLRLALPSMAYSLDGLSLSEIPSTVLANGRVRTLSLPEMN